MVEVVEVQQNTMEKSTAVCGVRCAVCSVQCAVCSVRWWPGRPVRRQHGAAGRTGSVTFVSLPWVQPVQRGHPAAQYSPAVLPTAAL